MKVGDLAMSNERKVEIIWKYEIKIALHLGRYRGGIFLFSQL